MSLYDPCKRVSFYRGLCKALGWVLLRLTWNPFPINGPELPPYQSQHRQLQFKRKISITLTDCNKKQWLSLFLFILAYVTLDLVSFRVKWVHLLFRFFYFLHSSFHVVVFKQAHNLSPSLSPGSDSSMPQARPSKTDFPSSQCHGYYSSSVKNRPCFVASVLTE